MLGRDVVGMGFHGLGLPMVHLLPLSHLPPGGTGSFLLLVLLVGPPTQFPEASRVAHTGLVTGAPSAGPGEATSPLGATREKLLPRGGLSNMQEGG